MPSGGALSGKFWNKVADDIYADYSELVGTLMKDLLADGFPPFHVPTNPREEMAQLQRLQLSDSDYFWGDPSAAAKLTGLEQRYGGGA